MSGVLIYESVKQDKYQQTTMQIRKFSEHSYTYTTLTNQGKNTENSKTSIHFTSVSDSMEDLYKGLEPHFREKMFRKKIDELSQFI